MLMMSTSRNKDVEKMHSNEENFNQSNKDYNASGTGLQSYDAEADHLYEIPISTLSQIFSGTLVMLDLIVTYHVIKQ